MSDRLKIQNPKFSGVNYVYDRLYGIRFEIPKHRIDQINLLDGIASHAGLLISQLQNGILLTEKHLEAFRVQIDKIELEEIISE